MSNRLTWKAKASIFRPQYVLQCVQSYVHLNVRSVSVPNNSAASAIVALKNAIHHAKGFASENDDIVIYAHNVIATKIIWTKPYSITFRGIDETGKHASVTVHFSQLVARIGLRPKIQKNRIIAELEISKSRMI